MPLCSVSMRSGPGCKLPFGSGRTDVPMCSGFMPTGVQSGDARMHELCPEVRKPHPSDCKAVTLCSECGAEFLTWLCPPLEDPVA